jgi:hypothetical protein
MTEGNRKHRVLRRRAMIQRVKIQFCLSFLALLLSPYCRTQDALPHIVFNHSEEQIPSYTEPPVLRLNDGQAVTSAKQWMTQRRPQILRLLRTQMFGVNPDWSRRLKVQHIDVDPDALEGLARREQITLVLPGNPSGPALHLLLYLPNAVAGRVPVFLGLNDAGNQSVSKDNGIDLNEIWVTSAVDHHVLVPVKASDSMRGTRASQWPIETILARGYGFATIYDGDLEPDFAGSANDGFRAISPLSEASIPPAERWGAIGVWAWGLSRALDYLMTDSRVNGKQVAVIGHSRFGKAALWAGAQDQRFGMVISNESGKGGAALMKRDYGETVANLTTRFSYWFCPNFQQYAGNPQKLPFDSPFILSLIAPRPLYIASSDGAFIVDPKGEFLAGVAVEPVYRLFEKDELNLGQMPELDQPIGGQIGYHIRPGKHDMTAYDWEQYLTFADQHFKHIQR